MAKDPVNLICDIAELATLFERTSSLDDFLQTVVSTVAWHMKAAVCSIYLIDEETQDLILRSNQGLDPAAIGNVRLKIGEGITGLAVKELRSIRADRAAENPNFKYIPGINEERYQAFLAVPILRGLERVGALVVQDPQPGYFDDTDARALRAIAAQMASTIQNANALMSVYRERPQGAHKGRETGELTFLRGKTASRGVARGQATIIDAPEYDVLIAPDFDDHPASLEDFERALSATEGQIRELQEQTEEKLADVASLIFSAHLLILKDSQFSGSIRELIAGGTAAGKAITSVVNQYVERFSQSQNALLREKVHDIKDVGYRLLRNLMGSDSEHVDYDGRIIIVSDPLPSDVVKYVAQRAEGMILRGGGITSHLSILGRSLQIPIMLVDDVRLLEIPEGTDIIMDANLGNIYLSPTPEVLATFDEHQRTVQSAEAQPDVKDETFTADGEKVRLMANVNLLSDLAIALTLKAEGIGLYRSEFPFIVRNNFPSEEEQFQIYRKIIEQMDGREVTFRTLDVGGDKMLSYFPNVSEANPFLGLRAIRFSLRNRHIFSEQLRALLRAACDAPARIMFPLIASLDDYEDACAVVEECKTELRESGVPFNENVALGVMIELPSAIEVIDELAREADFLSIGTNDLIQYMLAVDRTNEQVSDLYLSHHPAVLRAMKKTADAAMRHGKDLSICGDIAQDKRLIPFLIGIGLRKLSMFASSIPVVQAEILKVDTVRARAFADQVLSKGSIREVEALMSDPDTQRE
ncbi:MAG: phosphoenolpyruvate--protein phosphotransferase [Verrucomicrobia bacterium]|nr:phosphoenolpyruvate--protein phosphotransferase [Verrucomicrobiota bacterium]